jgi:hypothetical protein
MPRSDEFGAYELEPACSGRWSPDHKEHQVEETDDVSDQNTYGKQEKPSKFQALENRIKQKKLERELAQLEKEEEKDRRKEERAPSGTHRWRHFAAPSLMPSPTHSFWIPMKTTVPSLALCLFPGFRLPERQNVDLDSWSPTMSWWKCWFSSQRNAFLDDIPYVPLSGTNIVTKFLSSLRLFPVVEHMKRTLNLIPRSLNLIGRNPGFVRKLGAVGLGFSLLCIGYSIYKIGSWNNTVIYRRHPNPTSYASPDRRNDAHSYQELVHDEICQQPVRISVPHYCSFRTVNLLANLWPTRDTTRNCIEFHTNAPCNCQTKNRVIMPEIASQVWPTLTRVNDTSYIGSLAASGVRSQAGVNYDRFEVMEDNSLSNTTDFLVNKYLHYASLNSSLNRTGDVIIGNPALVSLAGFQSGEARAQASPAPKPH